MITKIVEDEIEQVSWNTHKDILQAIRHTVFVEEQGVDEQEEWDAADSDENTRHFLATDPETNEVVATARLLPTGKLSRIAVLKPARGRGIGLALVRHIMRLGLEQALPNIYLHAQTASLPFYQKLGFVAQGEEFYEAGIPHFKMVFTATDLPALRALYQDEVIRFAYGHQFQQHVLQMTRVAQRTIDIFSVHLAEELYGATAFADAVSTLARRGANSQVRILVQDPKPLYGTSHPLVTLAQRLSSSVKLHRCTLEPKNPLAGFCMVDQSLLVYCNDENALVGFANYDAAPECKHELEEFHYLWEQHSREDKNLKRLHI